MKRKAFTLIELLVVIAILALLIGILVPSLRRAQALAKRVVCAANLNAWSKGLALYVTENEDWLPGAWGRGVGNSIMWLDEQVKQRGWQNVLDRGEISYEKMARYMTGFSEDKADWIFSGAWLCPAVCAQARLTVGSVFQGHSSHFHYAYYAGLSRARDYNPSWVNSNVTDPDDLTDEEMSSDKLLMSDMIMYRDVSGLGPSWLFNHARGGHHAVWDNRSSRPYWGQDPTEITGINHMYGDGHCQWITDEKLKVKQMDANRFSVRRVGVHYY